MNEIDKRSPRPLLRATKAALRILAISANLALIGVWVSSYSVPLTFVTFRGSRATAIVSSYGAFVASTIKLRDGVTWKSVRYTGQERGVEASLYVYACNFRGIVGWSTAPSDPQLLEWMRLGKWPDEIKTGEHSFNLCGYMSSRPSSVWEYLGFLYFEKREEKYFSNWYSYYRIPLWAFVLPLSAINLWPLITIKRNRRRLRLRHGLCLNCAYDLRAHLATCAESQDSPLASRCPECGTPISPPEIQSQTKPKNSSSIPAPPVV